MMKYHLHNGNNINFNAIPIFNKKPDLIYCDMIYENKDIDWISVFWNMLNDNGIFIVQTDYHTNYLVRHYFEVLDKIANVNCEFINHLVWKNEWGNHPKDRFHQCYDDILIFAKGEHSFYSEKIQVLKATAKSKGLNPSGKNTKTATSWIDDICLTTVSKERIKNNDGKCVRWQKPIRLYDRILSPFINKGALVFDPFMGVASVGTWCILNEIDYIGVENSSSVFQLADHRMKQTYKEVYDIE